MKRTLSVPEVAEQLGITTRAAWQRIYRGQLPYHRTGRRVFILPDELDRFLKAVPGVTVGEAVARAAGER